ncbi:hypothetical protein V5O48_006131 [Marasmius crinis-equi]|uniref:Fork-head domain-containing protein n=1 Tax=Marasmius crinis-equi TaxID=585013 RepID=A0ABR3FKB8_9AGAR
MLSFKRAFVKSREKDHSGRHYWELDFDHLDNGYKRERRRGPSGNTKKQTKRTVRRAKDTPDDLCWGEYLEDGVLLKEESASPSPQCERINTQVDSRTIPSSSSGRTSGHHNERSRHSPLQWRAPIPRHQSTPNVGYTPTLSTSGPIYLYPVGHSSLTPPSTTTGQSGTTGRLPSLYTPRSPRVVGSSELVPQA